MKCYFQNIFDLFISHFHTKNHENNQVAKAKAKAIMKVMELLDFFFIVWLSR